MLMEIQTAFAFSEACDFTISRIALTDIQVTATAAIHMKNRTVLGSMDKFWCWVGRECG